MARSLSVDPLERLPWLADTERPEKPKPRRNVGGWLVSAAFLVAAAYAASTLVDGSPRREPAAIAPVKTVPLPPPVVEQVTRSEPEAASADEREALKLDAAPSERAAPPARHVKRRKNRPKATSRPRPKAKAAASAPAYSPSAWKSGVAGRIIQVGAFRTSAQAQSEWKRLYYRYNLLRPLPPRIVRSNIRGKTFYRLQLGTFSQAHSELLCQRLRAIDEGCMVLGLPKRGKRG